LLDQKGCKKSRQNEASSLKAFTHGPPFCLATALNITKKQSLPENREGFAIGLELDYIMPPMPPPIEGIAA
jgi:hypothetical protein